MWIIVVPRVQVLALLAARGVLLAKDVLIVLLHVAAVPQVHHVLLVQMIVLAPVKILARELAKGPAKELAKKLVPLLVKALLQENRRLAQSMAMNM